MHWMPYPVGPGKRLSQDHHVAIWIKHDRKVHPKIRVGIQGIRFDLIISNKPQKDFIRVFRNNLLSPKIWDKIPYTYMKSADKKSYPNWTLREDKFDLI
jgi:hypothetical protein